MVNINGLAREANDALYIKDRGILRIPEDNDISTFGGGETVDDFVDDKIVEILEGRVHRLTIYHKWRGDEETNGNDDDNDKEYEREEILHQALPVFPHVGL